MKETYFVVSKILQKSKRQGHFGTVAAHFLKLLKFFQKGESAGRSMGN